MTDTAAAGDTRRDDEAFDQWALVELMGHRRMAGRVTEQTLGGQSMLRIDVFVGDAPEAALTQLYGGSALYCLTPITETIARRFAVNNLPQPISKWDLPEALEPARDGEELDEQLDDVPHLHGMR